MKQPSLGRVMVAGTLDDPFATSTLAERMPMVRRFVNRFRRSKKVTSFETPESTMTVRCPETVRLPPSLVRRHPEIDQGCV